MHLFLIRLGGPDDRRLDNQDLIQLQLWMLVSVHTGGSAREACFVTWPLLLGDLKRQSPHLPGIRGSSQGANTIRLLTTWAARKVTQMTELLPALRNISSGEINAFKMQTNATIFGFSLMNFIKHELTN